MSNTTWAIITGLALAAGAALLLWRIGRKPDTMSYLKDSPVSRQWLMEHQSEDRS
jgi:LPXTG-motif cell wall-anchored protein